MLREKEIIKEPLYIARLENDTIVFVYGNYAIGSDGKRYRCVEKQVGEDEFEFLGWTQAE